MIAGTSSGGLITAMITTRSAQNPRIPSCDATQVVQFFQQAPARIFPATFTNICRLRWLWEVFWSFLGPLYSAEPLKQLLRRTFGDRLLSQALTSVIIPAFDTRAEVPVFFSNLQGVDNAKPLYNVYVRDACQATTAVPVFFPVARIREQRRGQNQPGRAFNVIDGGIAVNDPTLVAVTQGIAQRRQGIGKEQIDFQDVLVLSLGTGQHPMRFLAKPHWSSLQWLLNPSGSPLLNSFFSASEDMVEYYMSMIFDAHESGHHYLRIQTDRLSTSQFWGIDDASRGNFTTLSTTASNLLGSNVTKRNFATGRLQNIPNGGSNRDALRRFARWLVDERHARG
jgi:patatin-like phospholipase/acyl hydrolase